MEINMHCVFIFSSDKDSNSIHIYDGQGNGEVLHILDKLHSAPVLVMCYNVNMETVISVDRKGILEYWQNSKHDFKFPQKLVNFDSKLDTSRCQKIQFDYILINYYKF